MSVPKWGGAKATRIRARLQETIDQGEAICSKCGKAVRKGTPWDVDHRVNRDQAPWLTWEPSNWAIAHRACNRAAGAAYVNRKRGHAAPSIPRASRQW